MTDDRMAEGLWRALERLPRGAGVVFRHYGLPLPERRRLFAAVAKVARRRRLLLLRAGSDRLARHEGGTHNRFEGGLRTASAHSRLEAIAAVRNGADLVFVSPVHPTRSHPGAKTLGGVRLGLMTRGIDVPIVALGGMNARRFTALRALGIHGWAGIDAWSR